jgi:hypothetical protein
LVADQLYRLALDNADNFFLHKAALDALSYPIESTKYMTERYRATLARHPRDPVATYYYAYSLRGTDTPQMIRMMNQLIADHPEFPWPNLALADVYGLFAFADENKAKSSFQAFMKLCPESPEPTRRLVAVGNSDFLSDALKHMRANLALSSDIQSLLLYQELWYLEAFRGATGEDFAKIRQRIQEDLKRLQSLDIAQQRQLAAVIRGGYLAIGDRETFRDLFEKDTSSSGRWGVVSLGMQEWDKQNPLPGEGASGLERTAYWENRLRISDSWIKKMPEAPALWIAKLEALTALKSHGESEFFEVAEKALTLERDGSQTTRFPEQKWRSNILKLASLCADRGVLLDQVSDLIREGLAVAEASERERSSDFSRDRQWSSFITRFTDWREADDAWHALAAAYLRAGKPGKAASALSNIEPALARFKADLAAAQEGFRPEDDSIGAAQRQTLAAELAAREKHYAAAQAGIAQRSKK